MTDAFLGTWQLDPEGNDYQFGDPPQSGLYIIEEKGDGYLVTMKWTTVDGNDMEMDYEGVPDGEQHATPAEGVDTMSMTRVDAKTLDSSAYVGELRVAYARRELSADNNTMTVTQTGKSPSGDEFANVSVYHRVADTDD